jgi:hypothetical protein
VIPKRVAWFAMGAAAGAGGSVYARRKARQVAERLQPTNVAKIVVVKARGAGRSVADAVREGRAAAKAKEVELREAQELRYQPQPATANHAPTIVVIDGASMLDADEFLPRRGGPRRKARRRR